MASAKRGCKTCVWRLANSGCNGYHCCPGSTEAATAAAMGISVISRLPSQQEKEATHETMAKR